MDDPDHEDLVAEVLWRNEFCFFFSQEEGLDRLKISIHPRANGEPWEFQADEVREIVEAVEERLWELRKVPDEGTSRSKGATS